MTEISRLSDLVPGKRAIVQDIETEGNGVMRRRLRGLGLTDGAEITCLRRSPLGDPVAFLVRGAVIALRQEDTRRVRVTNRGIPDADRREV